MAKRSRIQHWLILGAVGVGLIPIAVFGLFAYMNVTKTPLHPRVQDVPSVIGAVPSAAWSEAAAQAREIARAGLAEQNLPGLSVAVGVGGALVWSEGFGWADLDDKTRVDPATRFRIGTASTALTSAAVGLLVEQGTLKVDDEIQTYVPGYPKKPWPVTLRQVMGHTAGVRNDGGDEGPLFGVACATTTEALPYFANDELRFEPGTEYRYSRYGWILVSAAIEKAAGQPFVKFMRNQVFDPLGMNDTRSEGAGERPSNMAASYFPRFAADPRYGPDPMRPIDFSCYSGASAFLSTPSDLVRFALAVNGGTWLKPDTVKTLQTSQRLRSGAETGYGLGWDLETATIAGAPAVTIGHDGDILGGDVSTLITLPNGIVVALTTNTSYADTYALAVKIADVFARAGAR
ncbi:MAG: beta-lactamase family protein [Acidobacteria bacterium]|nr:beta-lactamase family protein [Acidobacteriota bacterium]